jgi:hypothetical protein
MLEVLRASDADERARWVALLREWPGSSPACFPAYLELFARPDEEPTLLALERDGQRTVLPLLLRPVPGSAEAQDAVGPYGYGASFDTGVESPRAEFWDRAGSWLADNDVVSAVVRLPVVDDAPPWPFARHEVGSNIVRDIRPWPELWADVDHKVRKNYKRAVRSALTVGFGRLDVLDEFMPVYLATMARREAAEPFHFDDQRLGALLDEIDGRFIVAVARHDGRPLAVELCLVHGPTAYSFLGGTLEDGFPLRANDFLKCEIFRWCEGNGVRDFVLGGGLGGQEDGILRYKKSFAPHGSTGFSVGEWRVRPGDYARLVADRSAQEPGWGPASGTYPSYRG